MFKKKQISEMESEQMFYFNHTHGFDPEKIKENDRLRENINILATSSTNSGREFVAMYEHSVYPWIGTQFHPEKDTFEHDENLKVPKTPDPFNFSRKFAEYFHAMVRGKSNKMHFLDNRLVQIMKTSSTTNFDRKSANEVFEWNYFDYYHRLFGLVRRFKRHLKRMHAKQDCKKKTKFSHSKPNKNKKTNYSNVNQDYI